MVNFMLRRAKKPFFANISKTIHFRAYVASQVEYKCGHCECFAVSEKSLRPSQAEIQNYPNTRLKWNMGVETFPMQQNIHNGHIYIQLMKQHMP